MLNLQTVAHTGNAASAASKARDAEKAAALGRQAAAYRQTARALEGGKAGAVLRRVKAVGAQKLSAKAKAAAKILKERRAGRGDDPLAPHTPRSRAKAEQDREAMQERWRNQTQGGPPKKGQLAPASAGRFSKSSPALGWPSLIQRMIGDAEGKPRPPLKERIRLNRNKKTRPLVKPVVSIKVDYWTFDLAKKSREFRRNYVDPNTGKKGYWGESNIAVFEYKGPLDANGNLPTVAVKSLPHGPGEYGMHSEPVGLLELENKDISLSDVTRVYTERAPCMSIGNYCGTLLSSELPDAPVFHSFEYGSTPQSQAAGNKLLAVAINKAQKSNQ